MDAAPSGTQNLIRRIHGGATRHAKTVAIGPIQRGALVGSLAVVPSLGCYDEGPLADDERQRRSASLPAHRLLMQIGDVGVHVRHDTGSDGTPRPGLEPIRGVVFGAALGVIGWTVIIVIVRWAL